MLRTRKEVLIERICENIPGPRETFVNEGDSEKYKSGSTTPSVRVVLLRWTMKVKKFLSPLLKGAVAIASYATNFWKRVSTNREIFGTIQHNQIQQPVLHDTWKICIKNNCLLVLLGKGTCTIIMQVPKKNSLLYFNFCFVLLHSASTNLIFHFTMYDRDDHGCMIVENLFRDEITLPSKVEFT